MCRGWVDGNHLVPHKDPPWVAPSPQLIFGWSLKRREEGNGAVGRRGKGKEGKSVLAEFGPREELMVSAMKNKANCSIIALCLLLHWAFLLPPFRLCLRPQIEGAAAAMEEGGNGVGWRGDGRILSSFSANGG